MKIPGFLSYSHEDGSELTRGLASYLKNLIPNFEPVFDEDVYEGDKLEKIKEKLLLCNIMIVIITPAVLNSEPVAEEIKIAKEKKMKIIPCKDRYLEKSWKELPWNLEEYKGIDFENQGELKRKAYSALVKELENLSRELQESVPTKIVAERSDVTEDTKIIAKHGIPLVESFTLETKKNTYIISGGFVDDNSAIEDILLDRKSLSLIAKIYVPEKGKMRLLLKRELINSTKSNGEEDKFIVLIDGEETIHEEVDLYVDTRGIGIDVPKGAREIEIIGTEIEGISYLGEVKEGSIVKILVGSSVPGNERFLEPETLEIKIGEKVRWVNDDTAAHTITAGTSSKGTDGLFDSNLFMAGESFEVTFTKEGTYPYFDMVHPWIAGKIIVK